MTGLHDIIVFGKTYVSELTKELGPTIQSSFEIQGIHNGTRCPARMRGFFLADTVAEAVTKARRN